jgi:hypothetical protein
MPPVLLVNANSTSQAPNLPLAFFARRRRHDQVIPLLAFYARGTPWFRGNICAMPLRASRNRRMNRR